ncbi:MAG: dihydrolipoyl dehydrogenase [Chitinophagaceae bacterium]|nr:MAG: dihydrolipoyl dehydrogenase [Chitinophagaceae bacterium]
MEFDVVIIGSGPGGYVAAIRCAQLGMKTAIVERYKNLGGTCLNVGCIPSKALLDSSEHYHNAHSVFSDHGIKLKDLSVDMPQMIKRKADVVKQNSDGVSFLMKKNKITVFNGHGTFKDKNTVIVKAEKGDDKELKASKIIIATGSKPASIPNVEIDKKRVISSTEALELKAVPKKMVVIGGGIIGSELGSVYARLGCEVTVLEYMDTLIASMDKDLGKELKKSLSGIGIDVKLKYKVTGVSTKGKTVTVTAENPKGEEEKFTADYCLVAVGRKPYTDNLGLDKIGVETDDRGRIPVEDHLFCKDKDGKKIDNIIAIGDVIKGPMLAHKAEEEGMYAAEVLAGQKPHINYLLVPSVVYTWPEAAGVGYTEQELKEQKKSYKSGTFPFKASGRARASGDIDGLIKVLADKETDEILGVHMIGPRVADLIAEAVVAMEYRASAEDIGRICHAHPTYTEAFKEACLAATDNRALHM